VEMGRSRMESRRRTCMKKQSMQNS
jgi:hypothetical protein